jgi:hypothetical protein
VPVTAQQDGDLGPVCPDRPDDAPQVGADLLAGGPLAGAQDRRDDTAVAVEDDNRLEAVLGSFAGEGEMTP